MADNMFYRNVRAREQLRVFFLAAIASLLLVRLYLSLTGYPQLGGLGFHIGHMLWGGLFMAASITINLSFLGRRSQRLAALLGGIGFGIFIDELGKFITSDNNYFFRPTIGIIYACFVIMYLTFDFLGKTQRLTSREYQLNTLAQIEEAILHDLDPREKQVAQQLLRQADSASPITIHLRHLLDSVDLVPPGKPRLWRRTLAMLDQKYEEFWQIRNTRKLVRIFFIVEAGLFVLAILVSNYNNLDDITEAITGNLTYGRGLLVGQFASALAAVSYVVAGTFRLAGSRLAAFEQYRRATLVNLFLTEFFIFSRIQFQALPGFIFNLILLLLITYVLRQEQRSTPSPIS